MIAVKAEDIFPCSKACHISLIGFLILFASGVKAQSEDIKRLKALSIEELLSLEVTSVTKSPQLLTESAAAIQVITREDIIRSGATSIPEALRLASNLQVAQFNSNAWIISARGFNTVFANKLLVLIDGRTVYTPLFGGVLWDLQSVLLEDVDRIEVISGPGGTLWGANAVNGVINIITKKSSETQGWYFSAGLGTFMRYSLAGRYGGKINDNIHYRVYLQQIGRDNTSLPDGTLNSDDWKIFQSGFQLQARASESDELVVQGDVYTGRKNTEPTASPFDGQNIIARWNHEFSERSNFFLQAYYDRYWRDDPSTADELETYDVEFQHRFSTRINTIVWGGGYRLVEDVVTNRSALAGILPGNRTMPLYNVFGQTEFTVAEIVKLTGGLRLLHNYFSGWEYQPTARFAVNVPKLTFWGAASRAVRAPSRFDIDYVLPTVSRENAIVAGDPSFTSEILKAYEMGFRGTITNKLNWSLSTFYNDYEDVYSVEFVTPTSLRILNGSLAETYGFEVDATWQPIGAWRVRAGFSYFDKYLRAKPGRDHDPSYLSNDAMHRLLVQSILDLPAKFHVDLTARYLDYIPGTFATGGAVINEYFTFDARVSWENEIVELSVVGQNLWREKHQEFAPFVIPRGIYGRVACRF